MKEIILGELDIKNLKPIAQLSRGSFGSCYEYNDKVLKVFNKPIRSYMMNSIKKNIKRENPYIMYPIDLLNIKERDTLYDGYTCNKAPGVDLNELDLLICDKKLDVTFDDFLAAFYDRFLPNIKKENVLFSDIKPTHIFYDDDFYLIDTDFYVEKSPYMTKKNKDQKNLIIINESLRIFMNYLLPLELEFDFEGTYKDDYLFKKISNIKKIIDSNINTFCELDSYKFTDEQIEKIRGNL